MLCPSMWICEFIFRMSLDKARGSRFIFNQEDYFSVCFSCAHSSSRVSNSLKLTRAVISVLIGTALGAGELDKARDHCKKLFTLTFFIGLVSMALCCILALILPNLYNLSGELKAMATRISCVMALFAPVNFLYAFCFFVLRAGGDTRNASLLDSGFMWAVPVPVCILMALLLPGKISMLLAVLIVQTLMNAKIVLALRVLRKGTWVRNLTLTRP